MSPVAVRGLECLRCRTIFQEPRLFTGCPRCRQEGVPANLTVKIELPPLPDGAGRPFPTSPRSLWRFRPLIPVGGDAPISLGEGGTPLVHLERLGRRLGLVRLYAKDESQNPTWSYKDRLCSVAVT